ncbi:hypothetical protein [Janthinobacterium sp. NKUCC06_STL]|nr:hypothetical protein [Janthinobacterium sp. NKUCC06_STL]MBW3512252.1 hypothetical protein [Janthinobacterium sp. NKUCC06_STL]
MEKISPAVVPDGVLNFLIQDAIAPDQRAKRRKRSQYLSPFRRELILP